MTNVNFILICVGTSFLALSQSVSKSRRNEVPCSVPERLLSVDSCQQKQSVSRAELTSSRSKRGLATTLGVSRSEALSIDYTHHFGFQIITGKQAWDIDVIDLIHYLKALVHRLMQRKAM